MKTMRKCELCHQRLRGYGQAEVCPSCQEKLESVLDRHLELANIALTVKQVAIQLNRHPGHVRRILEHPEQYPWRDYGITGAYKPGKEWRVFLAPLGHRKELEKQLISIGESALNVMTINAILGLGPVLTPNDMRSLLECQITPLSRKKTPRERQDQKKRIKADIDRYVGQFFNVIAPFIQDKVKEMQLLCPKASTGRQLHT